MFSSRTAGRCQDARIRGDGWVQYDVTTKQNSRRPIIYGINIPLFSYYSIKIGVSKCYKVVIFDQNGLCITIAVFISDETIMFTNIAKTSGISSCLFLPDIVYPIS